MSNENGIADAYPQSENDDGTFEDSLYKYNYKIDEEKGELMLQPMVDYEAPKSYYYYNAEQNILITDVQYLGGEGEIVLMPEGEGDPWFHVIISEDAYPGDEKFIKDAKSYLKFAKYGGKDKKTVANGIVY